MNMSRELHYRYVVSYLCLAIILLIAFRYFDVTDLVDKFEFALTLSSLLLAVLAIFFTIVAAEKQDLQLTKLIETNARMSTATEDIRLAARDISSFAKDAPQHFKQLDAKLDNMSQTFGTLSSSAPMKESQSQSLSPSATIAITATQFTRLFVELQFGAIKILYLFERCYSKGKTIPDDFLEAKDFVSRDYAIGVLTVLEAVRLLSFKYHKGEIVPVECSDVLQQNLKACLDSALEALRTEQADSIRAAMTKVDAYVA
jgi:hypothetical protein